MHDCDELHITMVSTYWAAITCIGIVFARMSEPLIKKAVVESLCCK